jgi:hypothetical protein
MLEHIATLFGILGRNKELNTPILKLLIALGNASFYCYTLVEEESLDYSDTIIGLNLQQIWFIHPEAVGFAQ